MRVVINSFSKYFCMTGWRVGWMVVPEALVRPVERLQQNLAISVPTLSQIAAEAAFDGRDGNGSGQARLSRRTGASWSRACRSAGLDKFLPADGAFYLYADVSQFTSDSLRVRQADAGAGACRGHARHRLRSGPRPRLRPVFLRALGRRKCAKRWPRIARWLAR